MKEVEEVKGESGVISKFPSVVKLFAHSIRYENIFQIPSVMKIFSEFHPL
jgi:hypothetical protein